MTDKKIVENGNVFGMPAPPGLDELTAIVYRELKRIAGARLAEGWDDVSWSPTELVHEAFIEISKQHSLKLVNQQHLLVVAANVMRRVLINHAIERRRQKRRPEGGFANLAEIADETAVSFETRRVDILELEKALKKLAETDERLERLVELRFYGGMTLEETANELGIALRTANRDWKFAKAWLLSEIAGDTPQ